MKKIFFLLIVATTISLTSCIEKTDEFSDQITLGTGVNSTNYFELTGEGSEFQSINQSSIIYFRVESKEDLAGNDILLEFRTLNNGLINSITRENPQDYGHILVSYFDWQWMTGSYKVQAYIIKGLDKELIAEKEFTIY